MYQDMTKDRPTEVDYINGYIANLGRQYHYEAKTHLFMTQAVHLADSIGKIWPSNVRSRLSRQNHKLKRHNSQVGEPDSLKPIL